jgi:hypothetical protein
VTDEKFTYSSIIFLGAPSFTRHLTQSFPIKLNSTSQLSYEILQSHDSQYIKIEYPGSTLNLKLFELKIPIFLLFVLIREIRGQSFSLEFRPIAESYMKKWI